MDAVRILVAQWLLLYRSMKEVLLDEKVPDKVLKALSVSGENNSEPVENCEHETSCTYVQEMEEGEPIAEGLNL